MAEVFATAADGAATGFLVAQMTAGSMVLWVQDRLSRREAGRPYPSGFGTPVDMLYLEVARAKDALWAMEQALGCGAFAAVVGEVWGEAPALDFTATKRLAIRAEAGGVRCWLVRRAAKADLSAARERWRVASRPSEAHPHDDCAPGRPLWGASLFRARGRPPGEWVAGTDADGRLVLAPMREAAQEAPRRDGQGRRDEPGARVA